MNSNSSRLETLKEELRRKIRCSDRSKDAVWFEFAEDRKLTYEEETALQEVVDAE